MSAKLSGAVWELALPPTQLLVMLALADHAHDDGSKCYPGVRYLAWKTGRSERQVQRALRELEAAGLIAPVAYAAGGRGHATEYHIHIEKGVKKSPFTRLERVTSSAKKGDILNEKGDISREKGDILNQKGDIAMSPQPSVEPLKEPSKEPSEEEAPGARPDTARARQASVASDARLLRRINDAWKVAHQTNRDLTRRQQLDGLAALAEAITRGQEDLFWTLMDDAGARGWRWPGYLNALRDRLAGKWPAPPPRAGGGVYQGAYWRQLPATARSDAYMACEAACCEWLNRDQADPQWQCVCGEHRTARKGA